MSLNSNSAMVVLSGGQDSTICLGWALANFENVSAVSFDYGQKHRIELEASAAVVEHFRKMGKVIHHEIVKLGNHIFAGTSPLTNPQEELETYSDHESMEAIIGDRVEKTFVPMRNAVFLMVAANRAVVAGCAHLITGVCQADNANYPDCRDVFIAAAEETVCRALGIEEQDEDAFVIHAPLMNLSKAQSIELARSLPGTYGALAWSHTAYDGQYPPTGKDHASVLRAYGFEQAGVPDPLVLRAWGSNLMELPETANYTVVAVQDALAFMEQEQGE